MMSLLSCADISIPHLCESDTSARRYRRPGESCRAPRQSNLSSPRRLSIGVDHRHGRSAQINWRRCRCKDASMVLTPNDGAKTQDSKDIGAVRELIATADFARSYLPSGAEQSLSIVSRHANGRPSRPDRCRRLGQKRPPDKAPAILESKSPCPPPRNGISGPILSHGTPFDSTSWLIKMPSRRRPCHCCRQRASGPTDDGLFGAFERRRWRSGTDGCRSDDRTDRGLRSIVGPRNVWPATGVCLSNPRPSSQRGTEAQRLRPAFSGKRNRREGSCGCLST